MAIEQFQWYPIANATVSGNTITNDNGGSDVCTTNATSGPDSGGVTLNALTEDQDWEFRCRLTGRDPNGRAWIGLAIGDVAFGDTPLDYTLWQYCMHISTEIWSSANPPHPAGSVYIYEGSATPKTWVDGIWQSNGQQIRIICLGGVVRYYVDCTLIYRSLNAPVYSLEAVVGFACYNMAVTDAEVVTGPMVGVGTGAIAEGDASGFGCRGSWTIPTPTDLPQPPTVNAPIAVRFQEVVSDWREYSADFSDQTSISNTKLAQRIRMFEVEWQGLSLEQAALLDAHYQSTAGGLPFAMTIPGTGERVVNCRYASYSISPHTRIWSQTRTATIIRYTT